jgi:hypothetical protein
MKKPYIEFEHTPLGHAIADAILDLEKNRDLALTTANDYVIGYMCKQLAAQGLVIETALEKTCS